MIDAGKIWELWGLSRSSQFWKVVTQIFAELAKFKNQPRGFYSYWTNPIIPIDNLMQPFVCKYRRLMNYIETTHDGISRPLRHNYGAYGSDIFVAV